jgi:hypothetical protein
MSCAYLAPPVYQPPPPVSCVVSPPRRHVDRLREPTPPPIVRRCVKRNPTPPGDIIERVLVKKQPQTIIERITEQPRKPPPRVVERIEIEPCPPPIFRNSCVFVDPSPRCAVVGPTPCLPASAPCCPPTTCQTTTTLAMAAVPVAITAAATSGCFYF